MAHDGVDELALVVPLLAGLDVLLGHPALAEVDVALLLVDAKHHDGLDAADLDEAADGADPAAGELGEEDHALDVVVLEEGDVGPHVGDVLHLDHHRHVHLRVPRLVHAALEVRCVRRHRSGERGAGSGAGESSRVLGEFRKGGSAGCAKKGTRRRRARRDENGGLLSCA